MEEGKEQVDLCVCLPVGLFSRILTRSSMLTQSWLYGDDAVYSIDESISSGYFQG